MMSVNPAGRAISLGTDSQYPKSLNNQLFDYMVIIWRGLGFLVAVIVFCCSLIANLIFNASYGDGYYDNHKWPFALSLIISGVICFVLGNYLGRRSDRIVIDKQTGKEFAVNQSKHTLFFIPMHYWGLICLAGALILLGIEFIH